MDPNGEDATYRFEYAEEADYDANAPEPYARGEKTANQPVAGDALSVHHDLIGLRPGTIYRYRGVATNALGSTVVGADRSFTTPAELPPNAAPTADDDAYAVVEDVRLVVEAPGVLDGDADPDGDALSAVLASGPANGNLFLQPKGFFLYTPNEDFNGEDSFTYKQATARKRAPPLRSASA